MKIHPVFNTVKLRPYIEDPIQGRPQPTRPPPTVEGPDPEWNVEYVKNSKVVRKKLYFLVKWEGYPQEESSWEPASNLQHAEEAIEDFYRKHPKAPRTKEVQLAAH